MYSVHHIRVKFFELLICLWKNCYNVNEVYNIHGMLTTCQ